MIKRALISVSDKTGVLDLAQSLHRRGIEILSTGGTASLLLQASVPVTEVSSYTGFPEIMDGRVKTLHPRIHGGILARRDIDDAVMQAHDIQGIDLVVVNLYPFGTTIAKPGCALAEAIEMIDIGGPTLLRAAAKNHAWVTVVVDPADYAAVLDDLANHDGQCTEQRRFALAAKAFTHTAGYDTVVADYLNGQTRGQERAGQETRFPERYTPRYDKMEELRYGENPHQGAAFYRQSEAPPGSIAHATQLQGKALSFNNIADTDAALECVWAFDQPACVIVKHANPCGVAVADSIGQAYQRAYATDPTSAFGGIIAFNRELDEDTAAAIIERQFVEVIAAPSVSPAAATLLQQKSQLRVMRTDTAPPGANLSFDYKRVNGGLLVQDRDNGAVRCGDVQVVSQRQPSKDELLDLMFAWRVVKYVKSNAIVYCKDRHTIGIGAGQMSRVYSARLAALKAADEGLIVKGSVMASDAFFPFRDGLDLAAEVGIRAVIQPGGSMRDDEVIAAADQHDIAMVFTGMRHFRH